jgi:hypothetical protein
MASRKAFLVTGPESSGTKLVTRLFVESGCWGDYGHEQRLDAYVEGRSRWPVPSGEKAVVFRRSVPHGGGWPDLAEIQEKFVARHYDPFWVVTVRDWYCTIHSAAVNRHKPSVSQARKSLLREWAYIGKHLEELSEFCFVNTSYLFKDPLQGLRSLSYWTGFEFRPGIEEIIFDADAKYK